MTHDVVVVGGGIGGLTVAALLAKRGWDVCLLERDSRVGGCAANFEKFGYSFEAGTGIYSGWGPGEIHQRIFSELGVPPPEVRQLNPSYLVRLPDACELLVTAADEQFSQKLREVFPECAEEAVQFYRDIASIAAEHGTGPGSKKRSSFLSAFKSSKNRSQKLSEGVDQRLAKTSPRFRRFIDVQLSELAQASTDDCSLLNAALILNSARGSLYSIRGGGSALAESLASSIRKSGGRIRLDTPVLRLAQDGNGKAVGVDLLSGEQLGASKAVISNLTVWDTYGKLIGLSKAPTEFRKELASVTGLGSYVIFAGMNEAAFKRLPAPSVLCLSDWQEGDRYAPVGTQLTFAVTSDDSRAPEGQRAVTIHAATDPADWFTFHEDEADLEAQDQAMLEECWRRMHSAIPELGGDIEVIDTATPRDYYEQTRRKLGMCRGPASLASASPASVLSIETSIPNLFRVGDTVLPGIGIATAANSALLVADKLQQS